MSAKFINSATALTTFLDRLPDCKGQPPSLYVDLEGNNLSRHGTLSLITILVQPLEETYLIDVTTMGQEAFVRKSTKGPSLKTIFEADDICKVFFDVRSDSDALFSLHRIHLRNVEDLQLMEFASRTFQKRNLNGLAKCIERDSPLSLAAKERWIKIKNQGQRLFNPNQGGSYAVFDQRPLTQAVMDYCVQDVTHMPLLRRLYLNKLCDVWYVKIKEESEARIRLSHSPSFNGQGRHMALGPTKWQGWRPAVHEMGNRTLFRTETTTGTSSVRVTPRPSMPDDREALSAQLARLNVRRVTALISSHSDDDFEPSYEPEDITGGDDFTACDLECGYCGRCPY